MEGEMKNGGGVEDEGGSGEQMGGWGGRGE